MVELLDHPALIGRRRKFWGIYDTMGAAPTAERKANDKGHVEWVLLKFFGGLVARLPVESWRGAYFARRVAAFEAEVAKLSDEELTVQLVEMRPTLLRLGFKVSITARAAALVGEIAFRSLGLRPYAVQMRGAYGMLRGGLVEMATGEGKTLTAFVAAAVAALAGLPVHIVTVNDYLAERDAEEMGPAFERIGLSIGVITHETSPEERRAIYNRHVVYINNKEIAFDYLRDRAAVLKSADGAEHSRRRLAVARLFGRANTAEPVTRGLTFAIVDEADSILIDEALTPLILAAKQGTGENEDLKAALRVARHLEMGRDFTLLQKEKHVRLTDEGEITAERLAAVERERGVGGQWEKRRGRLALIRNALAALHLYQSGKEYVVVDDKVQIVDDATGRILPDRHWQAGLHQLIELKEQVEITEDQSTIARITYQRFFGRYRRMAGMSGTVAEVAGEIAADYGTGMVRIPTHRPVNRKHLPLRLYTAREAQLNAIADDVAMRAVENNQPVLIGVRSVESSEELSSLFASRGLGHVVLNAVQDKHEADVVSRAGQAGAVTIATNMAGRGTDIKPDDRALSAGGLHVILTELHESPRIDRQLFGRAGRQGQPGSAQMMLSTEDTLLADYAPSMTKLLSSRFRGGNTAVPATIASVLKFYAQFLAERHRAAIRRDTRKQDERLVKSLGLAGRGE